MYAYPDLESAPVQAEQTSPRSLEDESVFSTYEQFLRHQNRLLSSSSSGESSVSSLTTDDQNAYQDTTLPPTGSRPAAAGAANETEDNAKGASSDANSENSYLRNSSEKMQRLLLLSSLRRRSRGDARLPELDDNRDTPVVGDQNNAGSITKKSSRLHEWYLHQTLTGYKDGRRRKYARDRYLYNPISLEFIDANTNQKYDEYLDMTAAFSCACVQLLAPLMLVLIYGYVEVATVYFKGIPFFSTSSRTVDLVFFVAFNLGTFLSFTLLCKYISHARRPRWASILQTHLATNLTSSFTFGGTSVVPLDWHVNASAPSTSGESSPNDEHDPEKDNEREIEKFEEWPGVYSASPSNQNSVRRSAVPSNTPSPFHSVEEFFGYYVDSYTAIIDAIATFVLCFYRCMYRCMCRRRQDTSHLDSDQPQMQSQPTSSTSFHTFLPTYTSPKSASLRNTPHIPTSIVSYDFNSNFLEQQPKIPKISRGVDSGESVQPTYLPDGRDIERDPAPPVVEGVMVGGAARDDEKSHATQSITPEKKIELGPQHTANPYIYTLFATVALAMLIIGYSGTCTTMCYSEGKIPGLYVIFLYGYTLLLALSHPLRWRCVVRAELVSKLLILVVFVVVELHIPESSRRFDIYSVVVFVLAWLLVVLPALYFSHCKNLQLFIARELAIKVRLQLERALLEENPFDLLA